MFFKIFILVAYAPIALGGKLSNVTSNDIFKKCTVDAELSADLTIEELDLKMECILACSMKALGTMSEYGFYEADKIIKDIPKNWTDYELVGPALRTCAEELGENHCKTAVLIRNCMLRTLPCLNTRACNKLMRTFIFWNRMLNPLDEIY